MPSLPSPSFATPPRDAPPRDLEASLVLWTGRAGEWAAKLSDPGQRLSAWAGHRGLVSKLGWAVSVAGLVGGSAAGWLADACNRPAEAQ